MIFRKLDQSFIRIEFSDEESVNQKILRSYDKPMPTKIVIRNDGYKGFRNISVQTKFGSKVAYEFLSIGLMQLRYEF